jgi:hypothetical protein
MRRFGKFLHLPAAERALLVEAALVLAVIRFWLCLLPLRRLSSFMARAVRWMPRGVGAGESFPGQAARAVTRASACVPGAACLAQALAVRVLLQRRGYTAELRIGLARGESRRVKGHAWVECQGQVAFDYGFVPEAVLPAYEGGPHGR